MVVDLPLRDPHTTPLDCYTCSHRNTQKPPPPLQRRRPDAAFNLMSAAICLPNRNTKNSRTDCVYSILFQYGLLYSDFVFLSPARFLFVPSVSHLFCVYLMMCSRQVCVWSVGGSRAHIINTISAGWGIKRLFRLIYNTMPGRRNVSRHVSGSRCDTPITMTKMGGGQHSSLPIHAAFKSTLADATTFLYVNGFGERFFFLVVVLRAWVFVCVGGQSSMRACGESTVIQYVMRITPEFAH